MNIDEVKIWVGRSETGNDAAVATLLTALAATLDHDITVHQQGDEVPSLWHWTCFRPSPSQSQLGQDGHPLKGGLLPPISLPQRMWVASQIEIRWPPWVGDSLSRTSTITDASLQGCRTGPMAFIKLQHEVSNAAGLVIVEQQAIVYRNPPTATEAAEPTAAPLAPTWSRLITPSPPLLFRLRPVIDTSGFSVCGDRQDGGSIHLGLKTSRAI